MSFNRPNSAAESLPGASVSRPQVERARLLETIAEDLRQLPARNRGRSAAIRNFYGISGTGKSVFIEQISRRFRENYTIVWLDFDLNQPSLAPASWSTVIEHLSTIPSLAFLPDDITLLNGAVVPSSELRVIFHAGQIPPSPQTPLLLLLDHLDDIPYWKWLQEQIIKPLIEQQPALVVCASQSPLFWHFWELQELVSADELPPFDIEETRQYLRAYDRELLATPAQAMTGGYPMRLNQLATFLLSATESLSEARISEQELAQLSPASQAALVHAGVLRHVEVPVMLRLLEEFQPGWAGGERPHKVLLTQVLPELIAHNYFDSYVRGRPYRFRPELRRTIEDLLQAGNTAHFLRVCEWLGQLYAQRFSDQPITDVEAFNEWAYFANLPAARGVRPLDTDAWERQLYSLLERGRIAEISLVIVVYKDEELVAMLTRLGHFDRLQRALREHFGTTTLSEQRGRFARRLLNETELGQQQRELIRTLSEKRPIRELQGLIDGGQEQLIRTIASLGATFDPDALHERLMALWDQITPEITRQIVTLLHSYGYVEYDRERRTYQLTPLVKRSAAGAGQSAPPAGL
jgi:hypothetical protein